MTRKTDTPKTVLVTGGGGYIGSVLTRRLLASGYRVRVFDRLFYGREPIQPLFRLKTFELVVGDMRHIRARGDLLDGVDAVIHLAALSNDPTCDLDPAKTREVNFEGVARLAEGSRKKKIRRFAFASSCSVYGMGRDGPCSEKSTLNPVSLYAETMVQAEGMLRDLADDHFRPVCLRQATVFGLSPRMRFDLAINVMTLHAVRKKKIFVLGGGNQWRPFVHVKDTARVFQLCLEKPLDRVGNQVFNVGGDHLNFQISELARRVQKLLPETEIEMIPDNPDPRSYRVGFDHIQTQLGFRPEISVEEGIAEIAGDVQRRGGTDFDDSRYYNIKRVKELETIPAKKGGEPLCSQVDLRPFALHDGDRQSLLALLDGGKEQALREVEAYLDRLREVTGLPYVLPVETEDALGELLVESVRGPRSKELALGPFAPTFLVRKLVRHKIRFRYLDLKPGGWRVDESRLKKAVGSGTSGVAVSNFFGLDSIPASSLLQLVRGEGLILEDLNHRIGSMFAGREIPKGKRIVGFLSDGRDPLKTDPSFVLSTNHLELYAKWLVLTSKRTTGISSSVHFVSPLDRELGGEFFFPVDPRKAFFERIKLHALTRFRDHRTALFSLIRDQLKSCEWVEVPEEPKPGDGSAYHYFPLRLAKRIDPARFADYLRHENVDVHLSWNGNPRLTNDRFGKSILHTLDFLKRSAAIPLYDQFTPRDAHNIAHSVRKVASWLIKESKV